MDLVSKSRPPKTRSSTTRDVRKNTIRAPPKRSLARSATAIPGKVEGVIAKRIGRLDADLKEALTVASVQGETFTAEVIARVLGVEEQALVQRLSGELDKRHRLVWAREIEHSGGQRLSHYRFRHNLFQRYLYSNLDGVERAYQHEAVGNVLEELYAHQTEKLEDVAGQLARHFRAAGDDEKALQYYMLAGNRAVHLYAFEEAQQFLQQALKLSEEDEMLFKVRMELLEKLGDVCNILHKDTQSISYYQSALELWSSLGGADKMIAVRLHRKILETALNLRWNIEIEALEPWSQTLAASQVYLETKLPLAQSEPQLEWVRVLTILANVYEIGFPSPMDVDSAEGYAKAAVDLAEQLDAPEELSAALGILGNIYYDRGRLRDQLSVSHQRLDLSRDPRFGDQGKQMLILWDHSSALMAVGEYALAMDHIHESERLAIQIRSIGGQVVSLGLQAQCMLRLDRWEEILKIEAKHRELERYYSLNQLGGANCIVESICAAAHALQGNLEQARVLREKSYLLMTRDSGGSPENWGRTQYY